VSLLIADRVTITARIRDRIVPAIESLSFSLPPGRILGLVGESGAGKSMIAKSIAQLLPPGFAVSSGSLSFDGKNIAAMDASRRRSLLGRDIAFIPQEPLSALNPVRSIGSQFDEHLIRIGVKGGRRRRERSIELLESVHLPRAQTLLAHYPHELSGGMCQRVLIALAFASHPRLVIADEPTTALDVTTQGRIIQLITEMQQRNDTGLVFITHDLRLAAQVCDEVVVLYAGRTVERGPTSSVFVATRHPYTRSLLLANPPLRGPDRALLVMPGQMPSLVEAADLPGCVFAPRCAVASADCRAGSMPVIEAAEAHATACLHPDRIPRIAAGPELARRPAGAQSAILTVNGLAKTYARRHGLLAKMARVEAVKSLSLELAEGEFLGVVGESGSGKSTLARLLVGLDAPTSGRVVLTGFDVTTPDAAARKRRLAAIQMVFQDPQSALNPRRQVFEIVTQALEAIHPAPGRAERLARAEELLLDMRLPRDVAQRYPAELSGGQRQRVNIARALCCLPKVLVADEIVSGLDVSVQAQLLELLLSLREKRGFSMILISHDLSVVRHVCERLMVMRQGSVVEAGRTRKVLDNPSHPYTKALLAAVPPEDPAVGWAARIGRAELS
jgi:peptide/nickel transport system ATP-binding protein